MHDVAGRTCSRARCSNLHVDSEPVLEGTCHHRMPVSRRPPMFLVNQNSVTIKTVVTTKFMMKLLVIHVQKK